MAAPAGIGRPAERNAVVQLLLVATVDLNVLLCDDGRHSQHTGPSEVGNQQGEPSPSAPQLLAGSHDGALEVGSQSITATRPVARDNSRARLIANHHTDASTTTNRALAGQLRRGGPTRRARRFKVGRPPASSKDLKDHAVAAVPHDDTLTSGLVVHHNRGTLLASERTACMPEFGNGYL